MREEQGVFFILETKVQATEVERLGGLNLFGCTVQIPFVFLKEQSKVVLCKYNTAPQPSSYEKTTP